MSDGFFSRWSRRKRGEEPTEALPEAEIAAIDPCPTRIVRVAPAEALPEAGIAPAESLAPPAEPEFDLTTLPDIETVTAETDFTAFLRKGVPESLKRQALRRAWSLDPAIRDFCGPADYAWDFNAEGGVPGFSLTLGGDVAKLLAQAIGQLESWEDKPEPAAEAPGFLPPGTLAPTALPPPEPEAPLTALRLPEPETSTETELPAQHLAAAEGPAQTLHLPRRHGGAMPA